MKKSQLLSASSAILRKAKECGATLAGIAPVKDLKKAPSVTFAPRISSVGGIGTRNGGLGLKPGEVAWPDNAKSMLVIAVAHPYDKPEMDWWFGRTDPPGNRILMSVVQQLCEWIQAAFGLKTVHLPYHIEKGGTYLKDAAVLAGLGCIGRNNMLITPEYGPRVRLRALTLDAALPATGPISFDPCARCDAPCRRACPQLAFDNRIYRPEDCGQDRLPGRDGVYSRPRCNAQMEKDNETAVEQPVDSGGTPVKVIKYCRECELSCPVGR